MIQGNRFFVVALFTMALCAAATVWGAAEPAEAADLNPVIAIQAIPEKTHDIVSLEANAYRLDSASIDQSYVFTVGAGFGFPGIGTLGVGCSFDEHTDGRDCAVGSTFRVGSYARLNVAYAPDTDDWGALGTLGVGLRLGF